MEWLLNFLKNIFKDSPEKQKRKLLNQHIKYLSNLNPKVLEPKSENFTSEFIQYLFDIFHPLFSTIELLKSEFVQKKGMPIRKLLVDAITTNEQINLLASLDEQNIKKELISLSQDDFFKQTEGILRSFIDGFSQEQKNLTNNRFNNLHTLSKITDVDIMGFFKEFDSNFKPKQLDYKPNFRAKDGKYVLEDIKKMAKVFNSLIFDNSLLDDLSVLCEKRKLANFDKKSILESFKKIEYLKTKDVFHKLIVVFSKNIDVVPDKYIFNEKIVMTILDKMVNDIKKVIDASVLSAKKSHISSLKDEIFGTDLLPPLRNYSAKANETFENHQLSTYQFVEEMNLIKNYVALKYNAGIDKLINFIILKANFNDMELQKSLNDIYYSFNEFIKIINSFDENLNENTGIGQKIKHLLLTINKDSRAQFSINDLISAINLDAKKIIHNFILQSKALLANFNNIVSSYEEKKKRCFSNILNFDGSKTITHIQKMQTISKELVVFFNILKTASQ